MNRNRILLYSTILAVVILVVLFFINPDIFRKKNKASTVAALPENTVFFFKGDDFISTFKELSATPLWNDLINIPSVRKVDSVLKLSISRLQSNSTILSYFNNDQTIISLNQTAPGKIDPILIMHVGNKISYEEIDTMLKPLLTATLLKRTYKGVDIHDYQLSALKSQLSFAITDGLFLISSNAALIDDAISALQKNRVEKNQFFQLPADHKSKANLFINYRLLNSFLNIFTNPETQVDLSSMNPFGAFGYYEYSFNSDYQILRGNISDTPFSYISLFNGQSAGKMDVQKIISSGTSVLLAYQINNLPLYYSKYIDRLKNQGMLGPYNKEKFRLEAKYNISIEKDVVPMLDGPFALAIGEVLADNITTPSSLLIKVSDTEKALEFFYKPSSATDTFKTGVIETYREFNIYGSQLSEMLYLVFGKAFSGIGYCYYTNIRDYIIFCPDLRHLHSMIDDYLGQKLLSSSAGFRKLNEKIGSESNMLLYINPLLASRIPEIFVNENHLQGYLQHQSFFKKFEFLAFQLSNSNSGIYSEIVGRYSQSTAVLEGGTVWETKLDSNYVSRPYITKNHNNRTDEIIVFDALNQMYLIDAGGKIIWKKQLESPLMGDIYQVDYFGNDKLQYLFNTEQYIYMVDRNGNNVANYPVKLKAKASSGLAMFNFSSSNDFIFFTGCSNNSVYGYSRNGKPLTGWNPKKIKGNLSMPMKYFTIKGKTYYLGVTEKGLFYIFGTKGEEIIKPIDLKTHFNNPFYMKPGDDLGSTKLISADTNGKCYFVSANGKADIQQLGKWSAPMSLDYFDLNNDGVRELVFAENNTIAAFSTEGKALMSLILDNPIYGKPEFLNLKGKIHVAYLNRETQSIFLVNFEGSIYRNFPISCQSKFLFYDLDKDGTPDLIGGKENTIFLSRF